MDLKADFAQKVCVCLTSAPLKVCDCVFLARFPVCFCEEPAYWHLDWVADRLGHHFVQEGEIDYLLRGLGVTSDPSATHWSTDLRAWGGRVSVSWCVSFCLWSHAQLHFYECACFPNKWRKPVWVECEDDLWTLVSHLLYKRLSDTVTAT